LWWCWTVLLACVRQVGFRSSVSGTGRTNNCFVTDIDQACSFWHEEQSPERQGRQQRQNNPQFQASLLSHHLIRGGCMVLRDRSGMNDLSHDTWVFLTKVLELERNQPRKSHWDGFGVCFPCSSVVGTGKTKSGSRQRPGVLVSSDPETAF
jgi:hypothetical protein